VNVANKNAIDYSSACSLVFSTSGGLSGIKFDQRTGRTRLTIANHDVQKGQPLTLRLEFKNVGKADFLAPKWLVSITNSPSSVVLEFEDSKGSKSKGEEEHWILSTEAVNDWWTDIAPGHYYRIDMKVGRARLFLFCKKPGLYKLTAKYVSKSGLTPPSREDWHIPAHEVWKGEILSNVVEFQIFLPKTQ